MERERGGGTELARGRKNYLDTESSIKTEVLQEGIKL